MKTILEKLKELFIRFGSPTPAFNKVVGRFLTAFAGAFISVEVYLTTMEVPVPKSIHALVIISGAASAFWAAYHGAKVDKSKQI